MHRCSLAFDYTQGKDDMRMDERLMQVVRLADALMGADAATASRDLHARSFAMTPLGPRLGLVQWVEHTMPLFQASRRFLDSHSCTVHGSSSRQTASRQFLIWVME